MDTAKREAWSDARTRAREHAVLVAGYQHVWMLLIRFLTGSSSHGTGVPASMDAIDPFSRWFELTWYRGTSINGCY
eukprot:6323608-Amphidinium_carterae.1